ncbi:MAG: chemotaxis-specific protein-glutamate methyltransferase CheB [Candidatus Hydrogenedens sp.]|nr:chemotaxis-specific protein-glutamate methyltransferase CheB [Candidatus Hydrogenedens sp.]
MSTELNVMVVDDSALYRHILTTAVAAIPGCTVAATAPNGAIALQKMERTRPDLVLLDCEMPVLGGLETLTEIRRRFPETVVVMVSGVNQNAAAVTFEALNRGAIEFIPKPEGATAAASEALLRERLRHVCGVSAALSHSVSSSTKAEGGSRAKSGAASPSADGAKALRANTPARVDAVVIGISTGGPNALAKLLPLLPARLGVPVLIVQHMPPYFTSCLAKSLGKHSAMPVLEGVDGAEVQPDQIVLAPGGHHMALRRDGRKLRIALNEDAPVKNCRPAVDVLFRSAAEHYGANALAIVMTGMGDDGCDGARVLRARGARCITQSRETCVIYGMPRALVDAGLSDESLPIEGLADRIAALAAPQRSCA